MTDNLHSNKTKHIVLVDDDKDIIELYSEYLTLNSFKTISFDDPNQAINYLRINLSSCSLIITDYKMPYMSGIDLIKNIRKIDSSTDGKIKFILVSAFIKENLISNNDQKLHETKIDRILEKPVSLEELKSAVMEIFNK